jgi:16S rRNA (cytosine967-C5)-methyltransferase
VTDTRIAALHICDELRSGALLDMAFERYAAMLDSRNRRWLQQLMYGMLRVRSRLDAVLDPRVNGGIMRLNPPLLDILRLGSFQLLHMGGVPAYAAIAQSVELAKQRHGLGAGRLVNAVLRRVDRERENLALPPGDGPAESMALEFSHPVWLVSRWIEAFGIDDARRLLELNNLEPVNYVRPFNISGEELREELRRAGALEDASPVLSDGARLAPGVSIHELGAYKRGQFFIQDPAATLVVKYAAVPGGSTVADLCAAPGGKSLELTRDAGIVLAGDRHLARFSRMRENFLRLHADTVRLFAGDANHPPLSQVDAVLLDSPCTGTGTFRRHPDARWRLKVSDLAVLGATQRQLLRAAAAIVRPGGLLVYSTCSIEREENEAQVEALLAESDEWVLEPPPGTVPADTIERGYLKVLPQKHGFDGAFAARLRKRV